MNQLTAFTAWTSRSLDFLTYSRHEVPGPGVK